MMAIVTFGKNSLINPAISFVAAPTSSCMHGPHGGMEAVSSSVRFKKNVLN
ncbi:hypothetical protein SOVF_113780 [Spinacia oleracea]|nr:hypothetical protein SOVF_113780 [Spinacia oleracea]